MKKKSIEYIQSISRAYTSVNMDNKQARLETSYGSKNIVFEASAKNITD